MDGCGWPCHCEHAWRTGRTASARSQSAQRHRARVRRCISSARTDCDRCVAAHARSRVAHVLDQSRRRRTAARREVVAADRRERRRVAVSHSASDAAAAADELRLRKRSAGAQHSAGAVHGNSRIDAAHHGHCRLARMCGCVSSGNWSAIARFSGCCTDERRANAMGNRDQRYTRAVARRGDRVAVACLDDHRRLHADSGSAVRKHGIAADAVLLHRHGERSRTRAATTRRT